MNFLRILAPVTASCLLTLHVSAQPTSENSSAKNTWDITVPHGPVKTVSFETDEGTWMTVDVSPDGARIVFDLLGDIYIMSMTGGEAVLLSGGAAYEVQPRFSPDGKKISFTSDRDGCDNIWIMDTDGTHPRQITHEKERQLNNAVWTPDGKYLVARKHYRNTRSAGAGEMWLYHTGGGEGLQLTKRKNWEQDAGEPCLSPDGRYLYYSEDVTPGGRFEYDKDPNGVIYAIRRLDTETGKTEDVVHEQGGSARPVLSPDGRTLAFVRRVRLKTVLYLRDLESGRETPLFEELNRDQQEAWALFGVYPGFAWTPDGRSIVIWAKGKIHRIDIRTRRAEIVPFHARVTQTVTDALRFAQTVAPDSFDVRMLRWVTMAPDGKSVVFQALGKLWTRALPDGRARRLTKDERNTELQPSFSRDGKWIVYTTWNDEDFGAVWKARADGSQPIKITTKNGHYVEPAISPDGATIVYRRTGGDNLRGEWWSRDQGIYIVPSSGGEPTLVTEEGTRPLFDRSGGRIFLFSREGDKRALVSVGWHGEQRRVHLVSENALQIVPSPDEEWAALVERYNVYLAVFPRTGQPVTIGPETKDYPLRRLSRDAGSFIGWLPDGRTLYWSLGPELFVRSVTETFAFAPGAPDSVRAAPDSAGVNIGFRHPTDIPAGTIALTGVTTVTMKGYEVIRDAVIVIDRNRIVSVGPAASARIPANARTFDLRGKYVIPGFVDVHAHIPTGTNGIVPQTHWAYCANLAFGVTTAHDPSSGTEMVFANSEMNKAGLLTGPRIYSTGTILYGAEADFKAVVNDSSDALAHLRRLAAVGAFTVKSYNQPRRDQRQQILAAARRLGIMVVPEGGSTFFWNMTMVLDGHTGVEHNFPVAPVYKDVIELISHSGTGYTPTLIVAYGALSGENYWYMKSNVWENGRLLAFIPRAIVDARSRRRKMAEEDDFGHKIVAESAKRMLDAGAKVQVGGHGQLQGLGVHWEIWMLAQGGMTPMEALRCATLSGAQYIGLDRDLGSIEPGKLADMVILDADPLENIRNTEAIHAVMLNGRLYDAATLNEIAPRTEPRGMFWWERSGELPGLMH